MFKNNLYNYLLSASANSAPALNFATFLAAIWIFSLVAGLIPSRAGRSFTLKVPKPTNWILSPAMRASFKALVVALRAALACSFESSNKKSRKVMKLSKIKCNMLIF